MYMRADFHIRNIHVITNNEYVQFSLLMDSKNLTLFWTTKF